jgi:hypothetical protein
MDCRHTSAGAGELAASIEARHERLDEPGETEARDIVRIVREEHAQACPVE